MGFVGRTLYWFRNDQALHRSFVVMAGHEVIDGMLFVIVALVGGLTIALGAWTLSFVSGTFLGHYSIEAHDKHGDEHREMVDLDDAESYLWEGKHNAQSY